MQQSIPCNNFGPSINIVKDRALLMIILTYTYSKKMLNLSGKILIMWMEGLLCWDLKKISPIKYGRIFYSHLLPKMLAHLILLMVSVPKLENRLKSYKCGYRMLEMKKTYKKLETGLLKPLASTKILLLKLLNSMWNEMILFIGYIASLISKILQSFLITKVFLTYF